jgi:hypothetical protein
MTDAKTVTPEALRLWAHQVGGIDAERFNNAADALAASEARMEAVRLAADFKRNVIIHDDPKFLGRWIAVPESDFMALREVLAALAAAPDAPSDATDAASPRQGQEVKG